jgi:phenylacetate-CoA ligase
VPYYRDQFRECRFDPRGFASLADLSVIPMLTKQIIRREKNRLLADNAAEFHPRPHRSAGTTGEPIEIQIARARHSIAWADLYRSWSVGGWQLGDKQYVVAGAALRARRLRGAKARLYSRLNHFQDYTAFNLTEAIMDRLLAKLNTECGRAFLRGYASSMHALAKHAAARGWSGSVKAIFTSAEMLFPEQRKQIEDSLHGPVFDQWGCRDGGISAFECEAHHGMHLAIESAIVEICTAGRPVAVGETGNVVATDLFSYPMPIIRYDVGDVASYSCSECQCGRGLPLISSVLGRISGFLIGSGGRKIHGEFFSHIFWETPWVKEFQVVQDVPEEVVVRIVPSASAPHRQMNHIIALMCERVGEGVNVRIDLVERLTPGPMGKRQYVICRVPQ